jgi:GDPmannose 4,6-dehydratase
MAMTALITGVTGQDGYYLAKYLLSKGYRVIGQTRDPIRAARDLYDLPISFTSFELRSSDDWIHTVEKYQLDEIYHLAGVSFVPTSWTSPFETINANTEVTVRILEALRSIAEPPRFFYACSSEVFGRPACTPQNESTPMRPLNPYGVTKAASLGMIECYRERYGLFACSGILFNHESPRRDPSFVTRKITKGAARIRLGLQDRLILGNLDVSRDWGYAQDYVECMHKMLQAAEPQDFVIGTGRLTRLEQVVDFAFKLVDLDWKEWVSIDPSFVRANDAKTLVADSSKAWRVLGWRANTTMEQVIQLMVEHDLSLQRQSERHAA